MKSMSWAAASLTAWVLACGNPALAQPTVQHQGSVPYVETVGVGTAKADNNRFSMRVVSVGNAPTRIAALAAASAKADSLRAILPTINGLEEVQIGDVEPSISATGPGCGGFRDDGECKPTAFVAKISTDISAKPATVAGGTFVVLEARGFEVGGLNFQNDDEARLFSAARLSAFETATTDAAAAARVAGCQLGKLLTITYLNDSEGYPAAAEGRVDNLIAVTATRRIRPDFNLQVEPGQSSASVRVRTRHELICN